jgi:hypothetical protein
MTLHCWNCDEPMSRARLVIDGRWLCSDCVYEAEYGPVERMDPRSPQKRELYPQSEHLFPLPPAKGE